VRVIQKVMVMAALYDQFCSPLVWKAAAPHHLSSRCCALLSPLRGASDEYSFTTIVRTQAVMFGSVSPEDNEVLCSGMPLSAFPLDG
jgi:hypothetical protein